MVKIILSTNDNNEQLKLSQTTLDILKRYVESQGEDNIENDYIKRKEDNNCRLCEWG